MFGPYRWDRSIHDRMWKMAAKLLEAVSKLPCPGCYRLAVFLDIWRVEGWKKAWR